MDILVTGGAGFIGYHLCQALLQRGDRLAIVDDLNDFYSPFEKRKNLDDLGRYGTFQFSQLDICNEAGILEVVQRFEPQTIVHLAARAGVRPSLEQPLLYEKVNIGGTVTLLEAARKAKVSKFILASSSSVYGTTSRVPFDETDPADSPVSPYAASKISAERMAQVYARLYDLSVVCLRFFTVYGPRQRPDLAIRKFCQNIINGDPIPVFGDGSTGRDYTYVADIIQGILASIAYPCACDVFNLGNSHPILLRDLIRSIEDVTGNKAVIQRYPDQPGDVPLTFASIDKAKRELGYRPSTSLRDGLMQLVNWYLAESEPGAAMSAVASRVL